MMQAYLTVPLHYPGIAQVQRTELSDPFMLPFFHSREKGSISSASSTFTSCS